MKTLFNLLAFVLLALLSDCMRPDPDPGASMVDYLVFGHWGSTCLSCDTIYKIDKNTLSKADYVQITMSNDSLHFLPMSAASYDLVSYLRYQVPNSLLATKTSTNIGALYVSKLGQLVPDEGYYYIEFSKANKIYRWYAYGWNVNELDFPPDISKFLENVNDAISNKLK